ncbi:hypothetical protein ACFYUV_10265 [Nonomuraea sp. NPDC003560]|uniref:hypothetical protein n=1 Tax=Nonomuraea sp. NPDC003560 TaxID=3364341 RepID=UPI0036BBEE24
MRADITRTTPVRRTARVLQLRGMFDVPLEEKLTGRLVEPVPVGVREFPEPVRTLGKGNKERDGYVPDDVAELIAAWISVRGRTPGALFPPVWKEGRLRTTSDGRPAHMTGQALREILLKRFDQEVFSRTCPQPPSSSVIDHGRGS